MMVLAVRAIMKKHCCLDMRLNKICFTSSTGFAFLGAILNSRDGIIMVSEERIDKATLTAFSYCMIYTGQLEKQQV
jgi:hypothetical protein